MTAALGFGTCLNRALSSSADLFTMLMNGMKLHTTLLALAPILLAGVLIAGCSGEGPNVVDPESLLRRHVSLLAIDQGNGNAELLRFSEQNGIVTTGDYAANNNGDQLDRPVEGIYDYGDLLYLHHPVDGTITVLDLETRKKLGQVNGFPFGAEGKLTGMAFSNLSQAWVVCYGDAKLYEVDQQNMKIAHTVNLPSYPTSVGTVGSSVFVGMLGPDSSGQVAILSSNPVVLNIEQTMNFPAPIIYMFPTSDNRQCIMLSAGTSDGTSNGGAAPKLYYVDVATRQVVDEYEILSPPLRSYIGSQPNFAGFTSEDYLYLAIPSAVIQIDVKLFSEREWIVGQYPIIGVDYASGLLYAYDPGANVMRRRTFKDEELADVSLPATVKAIRLLGSNRVIR